MDGIKITADDIVAHLKSGDFNSNYTLGVTEFCPYGEGRRLDLFYFNRWNRETRGYEIKVSRADFLHDKKWQTYLPFCTWFYFIAPEGIIKPKELPEGVGLIEVQVKEKPEWARKSPDEGEFFSDYYVSHSFTKKGRKLHDVDEKHYVQLLEGLLIKLVYNKNLM